MAEKSEFDGSVVLITGGTGSFGQSFVKSLLEQHSPRKVIVYSRDEQKQFDMAQDPDFAYHQKKLRFFIGDVRDCDRLEMALREVDYVVHAAALKHITVAEYNPFECIRTNVHGAENIVSASIRAKVKKVIALSTDKAANPINLYGASKLASDKIFVAAKWLVGNTGHPEFAVVRYGNVIGSRGSVIPFFQKLIENGATELPITDRRMTRFWITLDQVVEFVMSCFNHMQGGEIFVPKIPSMKVTDLADIMAPGLGTSVVGIRPGEKLHEHMITEEEARNTLELPDRYIICPMIYGEKRSYDAEEKVVPEGFSYSSNKNTEWLDTDAIMVLLSDLGIKPILPG